MRHHSSPLAPSIMRSLLFLALYCSVFAEDFKLTVIHTNDIHARIDEFDAKGSRCTAEASTKGLCYGGISRQKYMVDKIRKTNPNSIFLNAGDYYQGSMWFFKLNASIISDTIKFLKHDAMTLGNHEFDNGSGGLIDLLKSARDESRTPILGCNVDFSKNAILKDYQPLPSMKVNISGVQIGLIGFITPETESLSNPDNGTIFTDEIECISTEANKLKEEGVKIIIAVGHSGYMKDQEIAAKVPLVKMVVGGHSHTYLSSVDQKTGDPSKGPYPTVVTRKDKTMCLVVQDFWMGKYLGYINVTFDTSTGDVKSFEGSSPLLLDHTVHKDEEVEAFLKGKRAEIDAFANELIGESVITLSGDKEDCRYTECAIGNMLADALTDTLIRDHNTDPLRWKPADIAIVNGGGIRGNLPKGNVTFGDLVTVYPFANNIWILPLNGEQVLKMYEISLSRYDRTRQKSYGGFLHSSGARLVANVNRPVGKRVVSCMILCTTCDQPEWLPLNRTQIYKVAMTNYIAQGGDSHDFTTIAQTDIWKLSMTDTDLARRYIEKHSPLYPTTDGRLHLIIDENDYLHECSLGATASVTLPRPTGFLTIIALLILKCK